MRLTPHQRRRHERGAVVRPARAGLLMGATVALLTLTTPATAQTTGPAPAPAVAPEVTSEEANPQHANPPGQVDEATRDRIVEDIRAEDSAPGLDVLGSLLGDIDQPADWDHYDIGASVGLVSRLTVYYTRLIFAAGMWMIAFARWVLGFVLRFDLGRMLVGDIGILTTQYRMLIDGPNGIALKEFMLLIAVAHAGWQIFRHRGQAAVAELLVAVVIALSGGYLLANAEHAACRGMSVMGELTVGMIALGSPNVDQATGRADYCGPASMLPDTGQVFEDTMFGTFVHEPFLLLQWGVVPTPGTSCRAVADALVETRSWDNDNKPRDFMREAGCEQMALFNEEMTSQRTAGALAYSMTAAAFAVAVLLSAGTLLLAQVAGAMLVLALPFAVVVGISPGAGRELLARWVHSLLKVAVLFMGSGFFLALLTTSIHAIQADTEHRSIILRMVASVAVAWGLVVLRGRIFKSMRFGAHSLASRVAGPGADVGGPAQGPGQVAVDRTLQGLEAVGTVHAGATLAAGAGRVVNGRLQGVGNTARRVLLERHHAAAQTGRVHTTATTSDPAGLAGSSTTTTKGVVVRGRRTRAARHHRPEDSSMRKPSRGILPFDADGIPTAEWTTAGSWVAEPPDDTS